MGHGHHIEIKQETFLMPSKAKRFTMIMMILGVVLSGIGIATMDRTGTSHNTDNSHSPAKEVTTTESTHEHSVATAAETHDTVNTAANAEGTHTEAAHAEGTDTEAAHAEGTHAEAAHAEGTHAEAAHAEGTHAEAAYAEGTHAEAAHAEGTHIEGAHDDAHAEHANVDNEDFGPRIEYHAIQKPWTTEIWSNLLVAGYFFTMISLCALFWYTIQYAANAGWSVTIKRVPEAMFTFIPVAFVVVLIALAFGKDDIYHWAHYEHLGLKPGDVGYDAILAGKSAFLNTKMLFIFPTVLIVLWYFFGTRLRALSLKEDNGAKGDVTYFKKSIRFSAAFLVTFGFLISVLAWLFMMSVDAHWYSTIFGVYNFATHWVSSIAFIAVFVIYLKSQGHLALVNKEHQHDLGKFMFAFTVFWAYIWLFQYLLIWYAHIPEEMMYYQIRYENYKSFFLGNFILNFAIPFLFLLMRKAKRSKWVFPVIGSIMIVGHYFDVWFMIMPGIFGPGASIGLFDIGVFLFFAGLFIYWTLNQLQKRGLVAMNHPFIEESVYHDTGI